LDDILLSVSAPVYSHGVDERLRTWLEETHQGKTTAEWLESLADSGSLGEEFKTRLAGLYGKTKRQIIALALLNLLMRPPAGVEAECPAQPVEPEPWWVTRMTRELMEVQEIGPKDEDLVMDTGQ
jgi:hypothetical protein